MNTNNFQQLNIKNLQYCTSKCKQELKVRILFDFYPFERAPQKSFFADTTSNLYMKANWNSVTW